MCLRPDLRCSPALWAPPRSALGGQSSVCVLGARQSAELRLRQRLEHTFFIRVFRTSARIHNTTLSVSTASPAPTSSRPPPLHEEVAHSRPALPCAGRDWAVYRRAPWENVDCARRRRRPQPHQASASVTARASRATSITRIISSVIVGDCQRLPRCPHQKVQPLRRRHRQPDRH